MTEEFRCPKCLNTNLAGSDAPIAADLRSTVHRLILEGATDQAIRDYLQARYGDFVLYDPPVRRGTLLLWIAPALLLAIGFAMVVVLTRRRRGVAHPLNDAEQARLDELLRESRPPKGRAMTGDRIRDWPRVCVWSGAWHSPRGRCCGGRVDAGMSAPTAAR